MSLNLTNITSYSRLESYLKCSKYFEHKYVLKTAIDNIGFNKYYFMGSYAHEVLEEYLLDNNKIPEEIFKSLLKTKLEELDVYFNPEEIKKTYELVKVLGTYIYYCTSRCQDKTKIIRNNNGSVPKDVQNSPPSAFRKALQDEGVYNHLNQIDLDATNYNYILIENSLCWMLATVYSMIVDYTVPSWIKETVFVELPISTNELNEVILPNTTVKINGFIDWIVRDHQNRVYIIDHKTSKDKLRPVDVLYHSQLNLYGYCYEKIYGEKPYGIGIHNLRAGEITLAQYTPEISHLLVDHLSSVYLSTEQGVYVKQKPTSYETPCYKRDWKTNRVTSTCEYIDKCWASYADRLMEFG
jgi:ATP-dependent helicase/DNAse subunit B